MRARQIDSHNMPAPQAHSVPVAARLLGIGPAKAWLMIRDGQMKVIRFGRTTRVPQHEVDRLLGLDPAQAG